MKVMQFQGMKHKASSPISLPLVKHLDLTPSPEVPLTILKRKLMSTNDLQESRSLVEQIHRRLDVSSGWRTISRHGPKPHRAARVTLVSASWRLPGIARGQ